MQRSLLVLSFTMLLLNVSAQQPLPDSLSAKLDKAIEDFKNKHHSPGLAVAIVKGRDIIYSQALGLLDLSTNTPVTIDSRFPIMSISKTFTATMLVQMAERGMVGLHDKVTKYVPEYKVRSEFAGAVNTTLFQLATHASGLPRNSPVDIVLSRSFDRWQLTGGKEPLKWFSTDQELLHSLKDVKLDYPAFDFISSGDRHYSNLGFSVLGIALQRAAKTGFAAYLSNNIFKPLQMNHSGCITEPGIHAKMARGYRYNNSKQGYDTVPNFIPNSALYPGGLYSSARDLARYISFQFESNAQYDKVLSMEGRTMMRSLRIGWKSNHPYVTHEGALPGYRSMAVFHAVDKFGWVILSNVSDIDFNSLNNTFAEILSGHFKRPVQRIALQQFAGTYALPQQLGSITITVKNDSLYSTYLQDLLGNKPLMRERGNTFRAVGSNEHSIGYDFVPDEQGNIKALRLGQLTWYKQ